MLRSRFWRSRCICRRVVDERDLACGETRVADPRRRADHAAGQEPAGEAPDGSRVSLKYVRFFGGSAKKATGFVTPNRVCGSSLLFVMDHRHDQRQRAG
jgi:hypothetical protein